MAGCKSRESTRYSEELDNEPQIELNRALGATEEKKVLA